MGRWSWVRISRPPWKRFLKKSEFPHVKNLINHSPWVPSGCKELRSRHVRPHTKAKDPAVQGGESVIRLSLGRRLVNLLPVAQRTNAFTWGRHSKSCCKAPLGNMAAGCEHCFTNIARACNFYHTQTGVCVKCALSYYQDKSRSDERMWYSPYTFYRD